MIEHDDDTAGKRDAGLGYPEEEPSSGGIDPREHAENEVTPDHDAPHTSTPRDGDAGQATGNPRAAGSDSGQ
jgi:hypothetical protein